MSKLIRILLLIALSTSLYAKPSDSVHIIASKNGSMIQVGQFIFRVVAEEKVKHGVVYLESKIKKFVDAYNGIDSNAIIKKFNRELQIVIIEKFIVKRREYKTFEPINLTLKMRQDAFVYLLGASGDKSCLVFPNIYDTKNQYRANKLYNFPSNKKYQLQSNAKGREKFLLLTSTKEIVVFKSSRCATQEAINSLIKESCVDGRIVGVNISEP